MQWYHFFSPAKVNLQLHVLGKGLDGYHQLSSWMQAVCFGDRIRMRLGPEDCLVCSDPTLPKGNANLFMQAVQLFRKKSGFPFFVEAIIDKKIPVEAGLGGGSSNAATALFGCNQLAKEKGWSFFSEETLLDWAVEIGADVPFFFSLGSARCEGRGEKVYSIPFSGKKTVWIVKPPFGLSTREVFHCLHLQSIPDLSRGSMWFNDLELPAFFLQPALADFKRTAEMQGAKIVMTGSGSAFVGEGPFPQLPEGWTGWKTCFMERQPGTWYKEEGADPL